MRYTLNLILSLAVVLVFEALAIGAPMPQNATSSQQQPQNSPVPQAQPSAPQDQSMSANEALSPESEDKLIREVRHELVMLPYYNVFDNLTFGINTILSPKSDEDLR